MNVPALFRVNNAKRVYRSADTNIIVDGNSIHAGFYDPDNAAWVFTVLGALPPINTSVVTANVAIGGQTIQSMANNINDVISSYQAGKVNYLICYEMTNSSTIRNAEEMIADITYYNRYVHSIRGDIRIIWSTTVPQHRDPTRYGIYDIVQANAQVREANAILRNPSNWSTIGMTDCSDVAAIGGAFDFADDTSPAEYIASGLYDNGQDGTDSRGVIYVHLSRLGFQQMARTHAQTFKRQRR